MNPGRMMPVSAIFVTSLDGLQGAFALCFDRDWRLQPQGKIGSRVDTAGKHDARGFILRGNAGPAHRAGIVLAGEHAHAADPAAAAPAADRQTALQVLELAETLRPFERHENA